MKAQVIILFSTILVVSTSHGFIKLAEAARPISTGNTAADEAEDRNRTIYEVSKQLCWGCDSDSLQFLFRHNLVRAAKWEVPLGWDKNLQKYAEWWAEQRRSDCELRHSFPEGGFKLGENVFWGSGETWKPADAVADWAAEEKYYHYSSNTCDGGQMCGHFTQIVWKSTRRVGCARVVCDDGDVFMTCNYDPPGNYVGQRPY
ncbi:PREDICTED: pathogenesis-related protein PR-1 [Tarenaya hassleriana]|uniref:pathogenesis-related protein PR-1 n=1 Tax=Tarenaya hassleriana TaxID=28532 RepID=UPI00053C9587|nr:PREDICTED: pathogenesis-related protein PR-1 [Tarenaya hassleriana]